MLCIRQYEYLTMVTELYQAMFTSFAQTKHLVRHELLTVTNGHSILLLLILCITISSVKPTTA